MSFALDLTPDQAQQIIYNVLRGVGLTDVAAKIITAQSGHETNGWTSNVWNSDNNGFGFGYDGAGNYYAFNGIEDSVYALLDWIAGKQAAGTFPDLGTITDETQYATILKSNGYYSDSPTNYAAGIQRWYNDNLTLIAGVSFAGAVAIFLCVYFFIYKKPV